MSAHFMKAHVFYKNSSIIYTRLQYLKESVSLLRSDIFDLHRKQHAMKMNQFDKNQKISFSIHSEASIREALISYKALIDQDAVLVNDLFDVEFMAETENSTRRLQISDTKNIALR